MKSLSRVRLFETPWTAAYQAPLSMGFSRQDYWSGMPLPSSLKKNDTLLLGLPYWLSWLRIRLKCGRPGFDSWAGKIPWRWEWLPTPVFLGFPYGSAGKRIHLKCGRPGFDPWVGKIPWRRERLLTPVFWPGEFLGCIVHVVAESDTTE